MSEIKISISTLQELIKVYDDAIAQVKQDKPSYEYMKELLPHVYKVNVNKDLMMMSEIERKCLSIISSLETTRDSIGRAIATYKVQERNINTMVSNSFRGANVDVNTFNAEFEKMEQRINSVRGEEVSNVDLQKEALSYSGKLTDILSSGTNGAVGVCDDVLKALRSRAYIQLIDGKYRVVGTQAERINVGIRSTGATYRINSTSFNATGLNLFLPKGSSIPAYTVKYFENLKSVANQSRINVVNQVLTTGVKTTAMNGIKSLSKEALIFEKNSVGSFKTVGNLGKFAGFDYVACFYPEGNVSEEFTFFFDHEDIKEVIFRGFEDKDEEAFLNLLNEIDSTN